MASKRITKEVVEAILPITANEIGSKCLQGINWALVKVDDTSASTQETQKGKKKRPTKKDERAEDLKQYKAIRKKLSELGFQPNEVMRVYKVPNGSVFDFDTVALKGYVSYLMDGNDKASAVENQMRDAYEKRKFKEMDKLATYITSNMKKGKSDLLVALFSTVMDEHIRFRGVGDDNVVHQYQLKAFALRHIDMQELNLDFLMPRGLIIRSMDIVEILPGENGISYMLHVEKTERTI